MPPKINEGSVEPTSGTRSSIASLVSVVPVAAAARSSIAASMNRRHTFIVLLMGIMTVFLVNAHPAAGAAAMISAKECGLNPMHPIQMVSQKSGRTLGHVLSVLRDIDRPSYDVLASKFRQYAACVGIVDTGFFRRRRISRSSAVDDTLTDWLVDLQNLLAATEPTARDYSDETGSSSLYSA